MLFRTTYIIDKLKLDHHFEESEVTLSIHRSTVLSIAVIVTGALVLVDAIPNFCRDFFSYYQQKRALHSSGELSISHMVSDACKILIGFLFIGNQKDIVHLIELKKRKAARQE